jgi:hypothetical protein
MDVNALQGNYDDYATDPPEPAASTGSGQAPSGPDGQFAVDKNMIEESQAVAEQAGGMETVEGMHAFIEDYGSKMGFSEDEIGTLKKQASLESANNPNQIGDANRPQQDGGASFGVMSVSSGFTDPNVFNGEYQAKFTDGSDVQVSDFFQLNGDGTAGEQSGNQIATNLALGMEYMAENKLTEGSMDGALRHYVNGPDTEAQRATDYVNKVNSADPNQQGDVSAGTAQPGTFNPEAVAA